MHLMYIYIFVNLSMVSSLFCMSRIAESSSVVLDAPSFTS